MMRDVPNIGCRSFTHLLKIIVNSCISAFCFGYANGYFNSISFDDVIQIYQLHGYSRSLTQGVLTGFINITGGVGAIFSSYLLRNLSRNQCFQFLASGTILVCGLLMIRDVRLLFIARLLQGLLIGATLAIGPLYIRQLSPVELTATFGPMTQLSIVMGVTYAFTQTYVLALVFPPWFYWRIVFGFPMLVSCIQLYNLRTRYPFETPKWLMLCKRDKQARELLTIIYRDEHVEAVYTDIKAAIVMQQKRQSSAINEDLDQAEMVEYKQTKLSSSSINEIGQTHSVSQKLLSGVSSTHEHQLTSNCLAIIVGFNLVIHQQMVGMGAIVAYSGEMVGQFIPSAEKVFPIFINIFAVIGVFASIPVLRLLGRKKSLQLGGLALAVLLFVLGRFFDAEPSTFNQYAVIVSLMLVRTIFSVTLGPIVWVYVPQVVQPNILPVITMASWLTIFLINLLFPILKEVLGGNPSHIFDLFSFYTLGGCLINYWLLIETGGKTELQIRQQFDHKQAQLLNYFSRNPISNGKS